MAKVIIAGGAYVVKSEATVKQLEELAKYSPDALSLYDEKKNPTFSVAVAKRGSGSVGNIGVTFPATTNDPEGKACYTEMIPEGVEDAKAWVMDRVGGAIVNLNELEATFDAALAKVQEYKGTVEAAITVM